MIKKIFWLLPFLCFIVGYFAIQTLVHTPSISTPPVIGMSLHQAFIELSNHNLNIRLLDQKEDPDLPEGTIINQIPAAHQLLKPRQTVFLTLSRQPIVFKTPHIIGKTTEEIASIVSAIGGKLKIYEIPSSHRKRYCIGQVPAPESPFDSKILIAYISQGSHRPIIWPNFIGKNKDDVMDFLAPYQLDVHIVDNGQKGTTIIDQRPLAGSIINLDQKPYIQLHVN